MWLTRVAIIVASLVAPDNWSRALYAVLRRAIAAKSLTISLCSCPSGACRPVGVSPSVWTVESSEMLV
jgi:hypothetical protein